MWMPTHVQVTVQRGADLITKGKNHTNDCFVTIALGKTKYQTSVKEKAPSSIEWHEECELPIPEQGNTAEIVLTALHRNFMGVDEFLGRVTIPLNTLEIYERPKNRWYPLMSKPGKSSKNKNRGQLEVKIGFTVKSGSLTELNKKEKHKTSIGQLSHVAQSLGGSLLSLGSADNRKGIKKFARSIGSKMHLKGKKKDGDLDDSSSIGSISSLRRRNDNFLNVSSKQTKEDADPGVISEDEDEFTFDELSHKSSASSLSQNLSNYNNAPDVILTNENTPQISVTPPTKPPRLDQKSSDEWESKLFGIHKGMMKTSNETLNKKPWESSKLATQIEEEPAEMIETKINPKTPDSHKKEESGMFSKLKHFRKEKVDNHDTKNEKSNNNNHENSSSGENESPIIMQNSKISNELLQKFHGKTREDMMLMVNNLQSDLDCQKKKLKDLEEYLDDLLLRVMETTPRILQNPIFHSGPFFSDMPPWAT